MLEKTFWKDGFGTSGVHGDKQQAEREAALKRFTNDECPLMFATDVAARGLDIPGVTHVVNFDMAKARSDPGLCPRPAPSSPPDAP